MQTKSLFVFLGFLFSIFVFAPQQSVAQTFTSPAAGSLQSGNFSVSVTDPVAAVFCDYRVTDSVAGLTRNWTSRTCSSSFTVTVGAGADCRTGGSNTCTVDVVAADSLDNFLGNASRSFSLPTLTVTVGANPSSGPPPISSVIDFTLGGSATGGWTATLRCDGAFGGSAGGSSNTFTFPSPCTFSSAGNHIANVEVVRQGVTASDDITVMVTGAQPPVIDTVTLRTIPGFPSPTDTVRFEASASDVDSDVVSILFQVESFPGSGSFNPVGECVSPNPSGQSPLSCSRVGGPYGTVGVYRYRAIATDDGGRTDTKEKTFEVITPPPPGSFTVSSVTPTSATENVSQRFSTSVSVSPTAVNSVVSCALLIDGASVGGMRNQSSGNSFASDPCDPGEACTAEIDYTFPSGSVGSHDAFVRCANNASPSVERQGSPVSIVVAGAGAVCGNGTLEPPGEQCDDNNTVSGDGCSATCQNEGGPPPTTIVFPNPLGATTFTELIGNLIDFLFTIAVIVAPILLVIAGVIFMTAAGDPGKVKSARSMLLWTVIGFGIILISKGLVEVLKGILGI